jgi:hypothetical protein
VASTRRLRWSDRKCALRRLTGNSRLTSDEAAFLIRDIVLFEAAQELPVHPLVTPGSESKEWLWTGLLTGRDPELNGLNSSSLKPDDDPEKRLLDHFLKCHLHLPELDLMYRKASFAYRI